MKAKDLIIADISNESPLWAGLPEAETLAQVALAKAAAFCGKKLLAGAEVSLLLTDDATIRELNRNWRKIDKATNVLSFPASSPEKLAKAFLLGDIVIAYETLAREALDEAKPLADHFSHLVVHGFLHLIGYDHETPAEAEAMESLEILILKNLDIADPYANADVVDAHK